MIFKSTIAAIISALSGMGVGGGGLFTVYLAIFSNTPQLAAQGMNLLFFLFSAGSSMAVHLRQRKLFPKVILIMALSGVVGSLIGTALAQRIDPSMLRKIFGGMLTVSGILALQRRDKKMSGSVEDKGEKPHDKIRP